MQRTMSASGEFIAVDPPLLEALYTIEIAAPRSGGVLITGPTGVGKECLARRVHERSGRSGSFVALNCGALVEGLAESTLFGHARGAFTGAHHASPGAFVEAHRGTLFLDEIGELDLRIQAKLLRALEDGSVRALGASRPTHVDLRVVAATNRDLRQEITEKRFRMDLYFRIATFVINVPRLSERPGDLTALISGLIALHDRSSVVHLAPEARKALESYSWPGNGRELKNVIERIFALAPLGVLTLRGLQRLAPEIAVQSSLPRSGTLARVEEECILAAVEESASSRTKAAAALGIHRTTLWRKMQQMGLTPTGARRSNGRAR